MANTLSKLHTEIEKCTLCAKALTHPPRPVVQIARHAKLLIIGQAPGSKVHASGIPWDDASGERLRAWLGINHEQFYSSAVAVVPMGFCYPGRGRSGDLPPRPECAPAWHERVLQALPHIELTLLIGMYAQRAYLEGAEETLTQNVKNYAHWQPRFIPLPHPSPRNNIWIKKNPWFEQDLIPVLQQRVQELNL